MILFFQHLMPQPKNAEPSPGQPPKPCSSATSLTSVTVAGHLWSDQHWRAEILWAMRVVTAHYSYTSCNGSDKLMFPDSSIVSLSRAVKRSVHVSSAVVLRHISSSSCKIRSKR